MERRSAFKPMRTQERFAGREKASIYGEGAYLCKQHGLLYPDERKIEQLKRKEWEGYDTKIRKSLDLVKFYLIT